MVSGSWDKCERRPQLPPSAPKSQDARPAAQGHEEHRLGPAQLCALSAARGDVCVQDLSSLGPGAVMGVAETSGGWAGAGPGSVGRWWAQPYPLVVKGVLKIHA